MLSLNGKAPYEFVVPVDLRRCSSPCAVPDLCSAAPTWCKNIQSGEFSLSAFHLTSGSAIVPVPRILLRGGCRTTLSKSYLKKNIMIRVSLPSRSRPGTDGSRLARFVILDELRNVS